MVEMKPVFEPYRDFIPRFDDFQESLNRPFPVHLRVNDLKTEPERLVRLLEGKGIRLRRLSEDWDNLFQAADLPSPGNLMEYFLGYVHPQTLTSCLAACVLCPLPGSFVLDMCASPGGKTSHMAQMMGNTGLIVANELYPNRHIALGHTLSRLGVLNTVITAYQAQQFPLRERFDYILADVPCSGEGRFRRVRKDFVYRLDKGRHRLHSLQRDIILRGFDLLGEQGEMLYATCTYNPEENESVVHYLLENRDAQILPIDMGLEHAPGLTQWNGEHYDERLRRTLRFYPHQLDSVGFFMARIGRGGGATRPVFVPGESIRDPGDSL
ncbi:MAG: RsmB/NOP family class I SAM-dependent RNA methyltransferase [Deltaproteobacteria bacterium]|nr:RsmB/NOP family class I SAM-dependent RNA methyltransferase [Deltaproteobacteria bacterium]